MTAIAARMMLPTIKIPFTAVVPDNILNSAKPYGDIDDPRFEPTSNNDVDKVADPAGETMLTWLNRYGTNNENEIPVKIPPNPANMTLLALSLIHI